MGFRLVDHTADLAIEAEAATREAVLEQAALGLTAVLTGRPRAHELARPEREVSFRVDAPDEAALVVAFLSELLWLHESEDLLWLGGGVEITALPDGGLRLGAHGNAAVHDPVRHGQGVEVKAVTYHGLRFGREPSGGWGVWVLLDI
jgi:SHS2 domain-containing protein